LKLWIMGNEKAWSAYYADKKKYDLQYLNEKAKKNKL